jgi:alpha-beta hydrolase superfamily lysophospholipase
MMWSMAEFGTASFAIDYRGHGKSEGRPCHVLRFSDYLFDVKALCRLVSERAGDREMFLFGNSLGGLIASHYGLLHADQLQGVVLTAPFFGPAFRVPRFVDACARVAGALLPNCCVDLPRRFLDQPHRVSLRWWTETLRAQQLFRRQAERFRLPVLMLHGQKDDVACPTVARELFERLGSRDKTFRILPGARHGDLDPIWGPDWWSEVRDWLTRRVDCPSLAASAGLPVR